MRCCIWLCLAAGVTTGNADASTVLVDFDRVLPVVDYAATLSLAELKWTNFGIVAASYALGPKGLTEGVVSTPNVAFNFDPGLPAVISGRPFSLVDAWFSSWQDNPLWINVVGRNAEDELVFSSTFEADTLGPQLQHFGWPGLTSVSIMAAGVASSGRFSIDDVRLGVSIPEPSSLMMLSAAMGYFARRIASARRSVQ